jgi:hypothetical protein
LIGSRIRIKKHRLSPERYAGTPSGLCVGLRRLAVLLEAGVHAMQRTVRFGETIGHDMVAVQIGRTCAWRGRLACYFSAHEPPRMPHDLARHNCINLRLPTRGRLDA